MTDPICLPWVSPVLGSGSEVSCPRTLPQGNLDDPVRLRTPGLRVKHFTTEPRWTPSALSLSTNPLIVQLSSKIRLKFL